MRRFPQPADAPVQEAVDYVTNNKDMKRHVQRRRGSPAHLRAQAEALIDRYRVAGSTSRASLEQRGGAGAASFKRGAPPVKELAWPRENMKDEEFFRQAMELAEEDPETLRANKLWNVNTDRAWDNFLFHMSAPFRGV